MGEVFENMLSNIGAVWRVFSSYLIFINMFLSIVIIFFQRKNPQSVWTWLLILYFIPIIGFVLYLLIGMDMHKRKMFKVKEIEDNLNDIIRLQENHLINRELEKKDPEITDYSDLVLYNLETGRAVLTDDNDVRILTDGNEKFDMLLEDMEQAKEFIHIQYYIIKDDVLFNRIKEVLVRKVKQGVEVRLLFDSMGCRSVPSRYWRELKKEGIMIAEFFPAVLGRFQLRMNYRNHRKIVVIDNNVAYVGGFNIGKEYIGLDEKFGYWRDTHLRIEGSAIITLNTRFLLDWNYAAKENLFINDRYFGLPERKHEGGCEMQIISSGPDSRMENIRDNYVRLIGKAKKSIYIQSPYFIPDDAMLTALILAVYSGIEVNIMIPCKPDHPFVYWATYSYIGELVMAGANCYTYNNGFLHAKGIVVDDKVFCYGTANMDIRSFALNFEVNAIVYSEVKAREMRLFFEKDLEHCSQITKDVYASRPLLIRVKEQVSRLLSPLL